MRGRRDVTASILTLAVILAAAGCEGGGAGAVPAATQAIVRVAPATAPVASSSSTSPAVDPALVAGVVAPVSAGAVTPAGAEPTVEQLIGQKMVVRMNGTTPSAAFLARIRRGEIGGVVLFGFNVSTKAALVDLTARLQAAAAAGGRPKLLILVDQEGGGVKRLPWAPPTLSARQMGADGRTSTARSQGEGTGRALRAAGVNVDLAPVADVPATTSSFMYLAGRTFGFSETKVSRLAGAFAAGVESQNVASAMKHFPGIGRAVRNTDRYVVVVKASKASLEKDIHPFRAAIAAGVDMIMLSNVTYSAYDPDNAAGWSRAISVDLLRGRLSFTGVTITDSLSGTGGARGIAGRVLAAKASRAGTDMVMLTSEEAATDVAFDSLVAKAKDGRIPLDVLRASYDRIVALKARL